jgi:hypothetical protein
MPVRLNWNEMVNVVDALLFVRHPCVGKPPLASARSLKHQVTVFKFVCSSINRVNAIDMKSLRVPVKACWRVSQSLVLLDLAVDSLTFEGAFLQCLACVTARRQEIAGR